jgi:hypothetical protein
MDWQAWAGRIERGAGADHFVELFAEGGVFCDPVTPWTTDVRKVGEETDRLFPDWKTQVDSIRGGEDWAVFEWTGTGTFRSGADPGVPIEMHGATVVEVDGRGKVTRWRDYLDTNEPLQQIRMARPS